MHKNKIVLFIHEPDSVCVWGGGGGLTELNGSKSNCDQLASVTPSLVHLNIDHCLNGIPNL